VGARWVTLSRMGIRYDPAPKRDNGKDVVYLAFDDGEYSAGTGTWRPMDPDAA